MDNAGAILCINEDLRVTPKLVEPRNEDQSEWREVGCPPSPMRGHADDSNGDTNDMYEQNDNQKPHFRNLENEDSNVRLHSFEQELLNADELSF